VYTELLYTSRAVQPTNHGFITDRNRSFLSSKLSRPSLEHTQPPSRWVQEIPWGYTGHLVTR